MTFLEDIVGKRVRVYEQRYSDTTNRYERVEVFGKFYGFGVKAVTNFEALASETCAIILIEDTQRLDLFNLKEVQFLDGITKDQPLMHVRV